MLVKRTASFAPFTLCRCFCALRKLVGENDSCGLYYKHILTIVSDDRKRRQYYKCN
jgi:hypothetical protein